MYYLLIHFYLLSGQGILSVRASAVHTKIIKCNSIPYFSFSDIIVKEIRLSVRSKCNFKEEGD
jgi:hypothetical protein